MTETGRDVVERLRAMHNAYEPKPHPDDEYAELAYAAYVALPAFLAVVEAAQESIKVGPGQVGFDRKRRNLQRKLQALHSQASDERPRAVDLLESGTGVAKVAPARSKRSRPARGSQASDEGKQ